MAKLFIREYSSMARVQASKEDIAAPMESGAVDQAPITLSGSNQKSAAFAEATRFIGVTADGIWAYKVGADADAVATVDTFRIPAGVIVYLGVQPGHKIGVIANT